MSARVILTNFSRHHANGLATAHAICHQFLNAFYGLLLLFVRQRG